MSKVSVNAPKTPVTKGSNGIASATLPNVCKMPGPPAPFVPTPLPNIGQSGKDAKDYSKTVTIEGKSVAIAGASFGSTGDVAAKGTGGGLISSNVEGPTKFIGPGSFDVQIEGKNVQLLGDPMLNNCGPGGAPPNAATMTGVLQPSGAIKYQYGDDAACRVCRKVHPPITTSRALFWQMNELFSRLYTAVEEQLPAIRQNAVDQRAVERAGEGNAAEAEARIAAMNRMAILRYAPGRRMHVLGYMVGILQCECQSKPLLLSAISGPMTPGFRRIAESCGFTVVTSPAARTAWPCAARQLMDNLKGHRPRFMLERWFAPPTFNPDFEGQGPLLTTEIIVVNPETGKESRFTEWRAPYTGENAPSCDKCQGKELEFPGLPALYCKNDDCA